MSRWLRGSALNVIYRRAGGAATYYQRDPRGTLISKITPGGEYYYAYDGQSSVIAVIDPTGVQRAAYTYDPYGSNATATALNGTLPVNPWRYDSGYLDPTGLYHDGARYYDPTTGRFTQPDPATSPAAGNRYTYAGCDPINNADPSGTHFVTDEGAPMANYGHTAEPPSPPPSGLPTPNLQAYPRTPPQTIAPPPPLPPEKPGNVVSCIGDVAGWFFGAFSVLAGAGAFATTPVDGIGVVGAVSIAGGVAGMAAGAHGVETGDCG